MELDVMTSAMRLPEMQDVAKRLETAGFGTMWLTEAGRSAYLSAAAAGLATSSIGIGTGIAVAFPRSPMVTAVNTWELADATNGRFTLGLGTQIKAHIERRYSAEYAHPGPRLREYVLAMRAIFRAFRGEEKLSFEGEFYNFSLLPAQWSPGPIDPPEPQIYVSAVLPWMSRMAGEVCDGVHLHPFHSPEYLTEVQIPKIVEGAEGAGRSLADVTLVCPIMTAVGDSEEEMSATREHARMMIAFYGSTRTYSPVFEQHGFEGLSDKLHAAQRQGDMAEMGRLITDDVLDNYIVSGTWDEMPGKLVDRYRDLGPSVRVMSYTAMSQISKNPEMIDRWADVARGMEALS